jgi:hypothetical protein
MNVRAEIIHQGVYHEPARYLRVGFITINVFVYLLNVGLMVSVTSAASCLTSNLTQVFMIIVGSAISGINRLQSLVAEHVCSPDDHDHARPKDQAKLDMFHLIEQIDNYFFCTLYCIVCCKQCVLCDTTSLVALVIVCVVVAFLYYGSKLFRLLRAQTQIYSPGAHVC